LKPITAGHVLVTPKRLVSRVKELTAEEMADLFSSVQHISSVIEDKYEAEALNIAIQV
jgi:bis(5'-adenosyl)-triphosphatase